MMKIMNRRCGLTLIELVITITILAILAAVVVPLSQVTAQRSRELELRRNLRTIRTAIDEYKKKYGDAVDVKKTLPIVLNKTRYPESLKMLVEGFDFGDANGIKIKFLRRIPPDPFNPPKGNEEPKWGLRSYSDRPDSSNWGGEDVYDVYSLSEGTAIDGTKLKDW
jgi:general secretion pathway protein G